MKQDTWTLRSSLWFVFLIALGLRTATSTWDNFKRGSVEYHRQLADRCEKISTRHQNLATRLEDELSSGSISDLAIAAEQRKVAKLWSDAADDMSLLAAPLAAKAELCEQSRVGWISLLYETWRNPPPLPVGHVSGAKPPWLERGSLAATLLDSTVATLVRLDFFGLACLALAIVVGRRFAQARGVGGPPPAPTA